MLVMMSQKQWFIKYLTNMIHYSRIIIGSSLSALIFAFNNNIPIFYSGYKRPFELDFIKPDVDLDFLGITNEKRILKGFDSEREVGIQKNILWERLLFLLSMGGKAPLSGLCRSMRYDGKTLVFTDEYSRIGEISFDECYYFGDDNCRNIVKQTNEPKKYLCHDWVAFNIGGKHEYDYIETSDDFVNKILFYISTRRRGNFNIKDACIISLLTKEQLSDFDYSETMVRFKTVHEMESRGMKARVSERDADGNPIKYKKYKISYMNREVFPLDLKYKPSDEKVILMKDEFGAKDLKTDNDFVKTVRKLF